ncbi:putative membrane protein [Clostridium sp. CAG:571]|nr:putative membrane protein [Clostridium sp. CAG:571]
MLALPHGKEIYIFFSKYGLYGIIGILFSGTILGILTSKVLKIIGKEQEVNTYNEFLFYIFNNKNSKLVVILNYIINTFLLITFYIMVSGFTAYFKQEYNIPNYMTGIILAILCYVALNNNIDEVVKISAILVPVIILFIISFGLFDISNGINQVLEMNFIANNFIRGMWNSIIYSSYNSIILIPVLVTLKKYVNKKNFYSIGVITSLVVIVLSLFIYIILLKSNIDIIEFDLPIIYIVKQYGSVFKYLYGVVIVISIFTSIISAGYSFLKNSIKNKKKYSKLLKVMCISSIFITNIGFSNLVNTLYPIFGILGIVQIYYILKIKI